MQRQIKKLLPASGARRKAPASYWYEGIYGSGHRSVEVGIAAERSFHRVIDTGHVRPIWTVVVGEELRSLGGKGWETGCEQSVNYPNSQPTDCTQQKAE
jgi:hypothetical protein